MSQNRSINFFSFLSDKRVPLLAKALPFIAIIYGISPLDVIPDVIPLLGQMDDVGVILVLFLLTWRMVKAAQNPGAKPDRKDVIDI